jgi:hypothetical protein
MSSTRRESTLPTDQEIDQKAAQYAELYPDGPPPKPHRLIHLLRRALRGLRRENSAS